jgi:hypothetical protein
MENDRFLGKVQSMNPKKAKKAEKSKWKTEKRKKREYF